MENKIRKSDDLYQEEEKDRLFELQQELIDMIDEMVKQQKEQLRHSRMMLAGFKALGETDLHYMDTYMDPLRDFMEQGGEVEKLYREYLDHIATFKPKEAKERTDDLEDDLGYKTEIAYAAAYVAREICRTEKGVDGDSFFTDNCWRVGHQGHDWKIKTIGFLYHIEQDMGYDAKSLLSRVKEKLEEWKRRPEETWWMDDFEDELMPFAGETCHPPTKEEWGELMDALILLNEKTVECHESYLARFEGKYLPIKVKLDDLEGREDCKQDYQRMLKMLWDYADSRS